MNNNIDKNKFKFSWDVPKFVQRGYRLDRIDNMTDKIWEIIKRCWKQNPDDRPTIQEIKNEFHCI